MNKTGKTLKMSQREKNNTPPPRTQHGQRLLNKKEEPDSSRTESSRLGQKMTELKSSAKTESTLNYRAIPLGPRMLIFNTATE